MMVRVIEVARKVLAEYREHEINEVNEETQVPGDLVSLTSFSSFRQRAADREGWTPIRIPPPPISPADLEGELRHWPGIARIEEAVLERAGVPREEAMRRIRELHRTRTGAQP